jgi:uncharacterized protein (TIGR00369 family)
MRGCRIVAQQLAKPLIPSRAMSEAQNRALERIYVAAPASRAYQPTISVEEGRATISVPVNPEHLHPGGGLHGAVLFKLLDDAAFFAANSCVPDEMLLTTSFHVHFLRPVTEGHVTATGRIVRRSRKLVVAEASVQDEEGRDVARGSGTFVPTGRPLADLPGFRDTGEGDPGQ